MANNVGLKSLVTYNILYMALPLSYIEAETGSYHKVRLPLNPSNKPITYWFFLRIH
jgi:hypothetical protein